MVYCSHCGASIPDDALYCPKCGAVVTAKKVSSQNVSSQTNNNYSFNTSELKLATWGERFVAWLIDVIILGVFSGITGSFIILGWGIPFGALLSFLYWTIMDGSYGRSIGKMAMHIKIANKDGASINMGNAVVESFGKSFLLPLDVIIGLILYPNSQQRLFNHVSETIVIKE